jgi:hypothetical protein
MLVLIMKLETADVQVRVEEADCCTKAIPHYVVKTAPHCGSMSPYFGSVS